MIVVRNAGDGKHLKIHLEDHLYYYQLLSTLKQLSNRRWVPGNPGYWEIPFNVFVELENDMADLPFKVDLDISDNAIKVYNAWKDTVSKRARLKDIKTRDQLPLHGLLKAEQFPNYQATGSYFMYRSKRSICGDVVGSGKSVQALAASIMGISNNKYEKTIVVMPRENLRKKWGKEIEKFTHWRHFQVTGSKEQRRATYREFVAFKDPAYLCIMYSTLRGDVNDLVHILGSTTFAVIIDEIQHCKNFQSKQSKATQKLADLATHVYALSATYMEGKLEELHSVFRVVNPDVFGSFHAFMQRYIRMDYYRYSYVRINEAKKKVEPYVIRRMADDLDHLDALPHEVYIDYWINLGAHQKQLYRRVLEEERLKKMERETLANQIATEMLRERQVCLLPQLVDPEVTESPKLAELVRIIDEDIEPDAKIVIFCFFQEAVEILQRELNKRWKTICIHGGMKLDRTAIKDEFEHPDSDVKILVTSDIFKEGEDLVAARYLINFDLLWNPAWMTQRAGRISRFSQKASQVVIISLITRNTVEQYMFDSILEPKRELMVDVIDDGRISSKVRQEAFEVVAKSYLG